METYKHLVEIVDRYITIKDGRRFVAGNANVDTLTASFDAAWEGCEVSVIFAPQNGAPVRQQYSVGMTVPPEALAQDGFLYVTFVGTRDGNVVIETAMQSKPFVIDKEGVVDGADPVPPTPSEYQQLMAEISRIRQDIEAGLIKGDPGDDADIAGAEAAKNAANEAATRANAEADRAHAAALDAAAATQGADRAARDATNATDSANDAAQAAREADTNATAAASNANAAASEIRQRADSGEFDGKDGKTPVKGVDYFDGEAGHSPVITALKSGNVTTVYADGVQIAQIPDGAPGSDATATDVRINGSSIVVDGVADIPAATNLYGAVKFNNQYGIDNAAAWLGSQDYAGVPYMVRAQDSDINSRVSKYRPIVPFNLDYAVKAAMCDEKGDDWSESERLNARKRIGLGGDFELIEEINVSSGVAVINRNTTPSGMAYDFLNVMVEFVVPQSDANRNGYIRSNNKEIGFVTNVASQSAVKYSTWFLDSNHGRPLSAHISTTTLQTSSAATYNVSNIETDGTIPCKSLSIRLANNANFTVGTKIRIYGVWA